ncbi:hypothetical protein CXF72_13440 [Psychromonas sp. MB-3u-54]|nr:hypothetical protein CXF72_13440 [Psychromonas sp. MB-3u-54]
MGFEVYICLSLEQPADQQVANSAQSNIIVAETIVRVKQLMGSACDEESLCQFLDSDLEQRVHSLLEQAPGNSLPRHSILWGLISFFALTVCGSAPLHNTIEALITL